MAVAVSAVGLAVIGRHVFGVADVGLDVVDSNVGTLVVSMAVVSLDVDI